jgi:25S rRNA (adenine2142-N1)-methyltransferase
MGRSRHTKRKFPVTIAQRSPNAPKTGQNLPSSASSASTRGVIRKFHVLLKRKKQLQSQRSTLISNNAELDEIEKELDAMGGLEKYQAMSSIGQSTLKGGGSEKVLINWLKELFQGEEKNTSSSESTPLQ